LWAPILIAILYYLAATGTFPKNPADWASLDDYFVQRKQSVALLLLGAEFLINYTFLPVTQAMYRNDPHQFWSWYVPYTLAIKLAFLALIFVKGKRANIAVLVSVILLFLNLIGTSMRRMRRALDTMHIYDRQILFSGTVNPC
jgi:hypothetical protein